MQSPVITPRGATPVSNEASASEAKSVYARLTPDAYRHSITKFKQALTTPERPTGEPVSSMTVHQENWKIFVLRTALFFLINQSERLGDAAHFRQCQYRQFGAGATLASHPRTTRRGIGCTRGISRDRWGLSMYLAAGQQLGERG